MSACDSESISVNNFNLFDELMPIDCSTGNNRSSFSANFRCISNDINELSWPRTVLQPKTQLKKYLSFDKMHQMKVI
jgi:hypothetical protein